MTIERPDESSAQETSSDYELDAKSNRYLIILFVICMVAGVIYGNTQFSELHTWKATLGGLMFGGFLGLCAVNYSRLNF